jgi:hypothetical protein
MGVYVSVYFIRVRVCVRVYVNVCVFSVCVYYCNTGIPCFRNIYLGAGISNILDYSFLIVFPIRLFYIWL